MISTSLTWKTGGQYRGVTITAGSAYVGELVQVLHDNLATDICVTTIQKDAATPSTRIQP